MRTGCGVRANAATDAILTRAAAGIGEHPDCPRATQQAAQPPALDSVGAVRLVEKPDIPEAEQAQD